MARLQVVADPDVPLHLLADRLREVGHWVPPEALERAIDAAVEASPPTLLVAVRAHLRELGSVDPDLAETYRVLAARTLRRARKAGLLPDHAATEVRIALDEET